MRSNENIPAEHFLLNMRIIADALERAQMWFEFYGSNDQCRLENIRPYYEGVVPQERFVYLLREYQAEAFFQSYPEISCIVNGRVEPGMIPRQGTVIVMQEHVSDPMLYGEIQDVFEKYRTWDWAVHHAVEEGNALDAMLEASVEVFRNPIFIHDTNFYILSDPHHTPTMSKWGRDPKTGREMVSIDMINDFRTDVEYLNGLKTKKPVMYSSNQTGYRILFRNLWKGPHYEGRILIDEVESSIQPGDYYALDYLAQTLEGYIRQNRITWLSDGNNLDAFFADFLERGQTDERQAMTYMQLMGWHKNDRYSCLRIVTDQMDFTLLSSNAILGQIDITLTECIAFYYDNSISLIINLTRAGQSIAQIISKLAVIIRESLLKVGISSEVGNFYNIPKAYQQARIALGYGRLSSDMHWYYYFDTYLLDYILDCAGREMPLELLSSDALRKLRHYDEENNAELYHTLEVYLRLEKNVLQTSKELFIHRSTLAYRLERIQKLIGVNLDDPKVRLKLLISYYMESGLTSS